MAHYATIEDNTVTGVYDLLPQNWKNISNFYALKDDTEYLNSLGWRTVVKVNPDYNPDTQRLGNPYYTIENDQVIERIEVIDLPKPPEPVQLTEEEIAAQNLALHNQAIEKLRIKRDKLLQETDYTQLSDVMALNGTELTTQFQIYRQTLRDLPAQYESDLSFVDESTIVYPILPGVN